MTEDANGVTGGSTGVDVPFRSATALAAAIRAGELSSRDLLTTYLSRIEELDTSVNSVVAVDAELAMAEATAADDAVARGRTVGPLHGVPCTVKDAIETAGMRSTSGAPVLADHVPHTDATAVARLRGAGAVVFGKTNVPIWAGDMQTYNELFGATSNPWALDRSAGGSSGGAAAAVACGFTGFELGTDIGGSIRIPSHLCGVFGLRPSYGLIPQRGYLAGTRRGIADLDNNVFGPIARDAADLALLLGVLAGPARRHERAWRLDLPGPSANCLSGYRFGLWLDDPFCAVSTECLGVIRCAVERIAQAGGRVHDSHPGVDFEDSFRTYWTLLMASNGLNSPDSTLTHAAWLDADDRRARQRRSWHEWFSSGFDVLLCPVMATTAYPHDHSGYFGTRYVTVNGQRRSHDDIARWTGLVGALGLPAAAVPIGRTPEGLPVGLQIVAPYLHDSDAVQAADLIAQVTGGYTPPPAATSLTR